jgi:hypothetical protein
MTPETVASRARITSLIVATAFFMEQLDGSVIATSLPQIARSASTRSTSASA